jgi:hypothetical protein
MCFTREELAVPVLPTAGKLRPLSDGLIMNLVCRILVSSPFRGRNGFDGITGRKMRAEDHGLAKNMELKLTADQPLALAA